MAVRQVGPTFANMVLPLFQGVAKVTDGVAPWTLVKPLPSCQLNKEIAPFNLCVKTAPYSKPVWFVVLDYTDASLIHRIGQDARHDMPEVHAYIPA